MQNFPRLVWPGLYSCTGQRFSSGLVPLGFKTQKDDLLRQRFANSCFYISTRGWGIHTTLLHRSYITEAKAQNAVHTNVGFNMCELLCSYTEISQVLSNTYTISVFSCLIFPFSFHSRAKILCARTQMACKKKNYNIKTVFGKDFKYQLRCTVYILVVLL